LQFILGDSWAAIITDFKSGKLEILPAVVEIQERKSFMNFTNHYITLPTVLATQKDNSQVNNLGDLKGRTLAVIDGFYYVDMIQQAYPEIKLLKVAGSLDGLEAVVYNPNIS
jgi:ABC-type amino acid transport substrate-binding protein